MTAEASYHPLPVDQSDVQYLHGPDSFSRADVPAGSTVEFDWRESAAYPGTSHRFWVHAPAR